MKKVAYDAMKFDALKIVEDSKCCLKVNAVISKAGVYRYEDGMAFKPSTELKKAAEALRFSGAKLILHNHPASKIIMSTKDIYGGVEKPYFDRDKIYATLNFNKTVVPDSLLQQIRNAATRKIPLDNSIGFYYDHVATPGTAPHVNTGLPTHYDYIMRDIMIDHVAVMFDNKVRGRCTFPNCGIGVDAVMQELSERSVKTDKVVKRGDKWCVIHCHGEKAGQAIKCFSTKEQAEAMHRAIQAQKSGGTKMSNNYEIYFAKVDQDKRPPKDWWDNCTSKAQNFASDPNRFCNWAWYEAGEKMRSSFGGATQSPGGMKETMSLEEMYYPERSKEYNECVSQRITEGMTRGEAEAHCAAATKPEEEPTPQGAPAAPSEYTTGEAQETFEACVKDKMAGGMSKEEAEEACRTKQPVGEGQEPEKTPMERCVEEQMEQGKSSEEAKSWCQSELSGEHEAVDAMIAKGNKLLKMRQQRNIQRKKDARRHPLW